MGDLKAGPKFWTDREPFLLLGCRTDAEMGDSDFAFTQNGRFSESHYIAIVNGYFAKTSPPMKSCYWLCTRIPSCTKSQDSAQKRIPRIGGLFSLYKTGNCHLQLQSGFVSCRPTSFCHNCSKDAILVSGQNDVTPSLIRPVLHDNSEK